MPFKGYRQTSSYGHRTHPVSGAKQSFHAGIDLVKLKGGVNATIQAFTGGTVVYAGFGNAGTGLGGYGNVVLIKDKNGNGQLYAHLNSVSVKIGQSVKKGQTIGKQGATGNVTGAHLHYEVRKTTTPSYGWTSNKSTSTVDPTQYLKGYSAPKDSITVGIQKWIGTIADGFNGPNTQKSLIKKLQSELNTQFSAGLKVDGVWGPRTLAAIVTIRNGATGNLTRVLQSALYLAGYTVVGEPDGVFGDNTYTALGDFQRTNKLLVDHVAGKATFTKLFA